ncbi:MAG: sulfatase-like hydrolase/transferase, partial [Planctomycetota bacterium]
MTSELPGWRNVWFRTVATATGVGTVAGLLDSLRITLDGTTVFGFDDWAGVVLVYAGVWACLAFPAAPLARILFRRHALRLCGPLVVLATIWFCALGLVEGTLVPMGSRGLSLAIEGLLVLAGVSVLGLGLLRLGWTAGKPRLWIGTFLLCAGVSVLAPHFSGPAGDPDGVRVGRRADSGQPSVLFLVVDALRSDHTSLHGYHRETTPNLSTFAENALVFDCARADTNWTKGSVASMFTGLPPFVHGQHQAQHHLADRAITLAECFRSAGYRTGGFSDNPFITPTFGMTQGFDEFAWQNESGHSIFRRVTLLGRCFRYLGVPTVDLLLGRTKKV